MRMTRRKHFFLAIPPLNRVACAQVSAASRIKALLGFSAYQGTPLVSLSLGDRYVERARELRGGQLTGLPSSQTRWLLSDLEQAQREADAGTLSRAAQLWNACKTDGVFMGVASTRTGGLVRLPKHFRGDRKMVSVLEAGRESVRSVFDEMFPASELAKMALDGLGLGVSIGEMVPVVGRNYPVLVTHNPEYLTYRWHENTWYMSTIAGAIPIIPGDGRWILHTPGGRVNPWRDGIWRSIARAFIMKEHALNHDQSWQNKLANALRVGVAPQASSLNQRLTFMQQLAQWSANTILSLTPGWDIKLVESNGVGHEAFQACVTRSEREYVLCVAGQEVTTDGGAGFQNSDIHKSIRADLIQITADELAYTINTQGIPPWVVDNYGEDALDGSPCVAWDVTPPKDAAAEAAALQTTVAAITAAEELAARFGMQVDPRSIQEELEKHLGLILRKAPNVAKV